MVRRQLAKRGVQDERVLAAMAKVPRHLFVPSQSRSEAYEDCPLSIGHGQTISQPYMVASMTEALALNRKDRVLEVGTGSGYQTAVLAELVDKVYTVERIKTLSDSARVVLDSLGLSERVGMRVGDGTSGWADMAPFDAILVTAGAPGVPSPLLAQLSPGGCLVIPVGAKQMQRIEIHRRDLSGELTKESSTSCRFVNLVGRHGWPKGE
ncbi:MAG: protein-L-isoaspartate(D-aspartate) O-methyltransferase [Deltaproteobacteria bacterium]|nr:protein-L-isoaspartate(D-aspartate) O-methyltransferase [Deltaproteobacteria bacterium]